MVGTNIAFRNVLSDISVGVVNQCLEFGLTLTLAVRRVGGSSAEPF